MHCNNIDTSLVLGVSCPKEVKHTIHTYFVPTYLVLGLALQILSYFWMPTHPMSLVSGMLGICSVLLCSEGSLWTFVFGMGQIVTYTYLCYLERFYAGIGINVFYFISQI